MQKTKIFIASSNQGKIREIQEIFKDYEIITDRLKFEHLEVQENADSFEGNALIKAKALFETLPYMQNFLTMADDSGLCIDDLNGEPGIYSARYANIKLGIMKNSSDDANIACIIKQMKEKSLQSSKAKFIASVAIVGRINGNNLEFVTRGELQGDVINSPRGKNGFGYDPIFIPQGYSQTLGELQAKEKNKISHRKKALEKINDFLSNQDLKNF
ncbi:RdgB/HAM1 family non-canonical purine NTP pyrophosphatase [Helicobacter cappadocius]|uniref:dITP/XTP pyrophosphatase n=1 Tax=Helicobacter cappadocius TaxID=3063998 RepID=A0AA90PU32_9HELI|nr:MULTISPECIES: RdgB/HAM1 family non-canonical purine NTP pyrophosphatase [unclassified Helicobacter]MDO7253636.1 RdgB/HAM1 family non-canonical purine NTP pyrophosphatase [Helicobacter sp. faydin-H75]MDP2539564.1 RdgB/HAM1 family non-canonical purine NTP pyrophosphatase [Helicobacter sp. faydin-H76]